MRANVLVTGAFPGETDFLREQSGKLNILDCGVGNIAAGINLARYLAGHPEIEHIIFTGSAGYYPKAGHKFSIHQLVMAQVFHSCAISDILGITRSPEIRRNKITTDPFPELNEFLQQKNIPSGSVNGTDSITVTDLSADLLEKSCLRNCDFENMESFGLAMTAGIFRKSFTGIYALTNSVSASGSSEWQKNWRQSSTLLQNFISEFLFR